jgi:hypothetical protein
MRLGRLLAIASLAIANASCISELDKYFKTKEINRLAILRTDVRPGRLIIARKGKLGLRDDILSLAPGAKLTYQGFKAVFNAYEATSEITPSVGLKAVIEAVLPIDFSSKVKLTNSAKIKQIDATGESVESQEIVKLVDDPKNAELVKFILDHSSKNTVVAVVLQTYSAKRLSIEAASGKDITANLAVGEKETLGGSVGGDIKRSTKETLELTGDQYYVFGIRAFAFEVKEQGGKPVLSTKVLDLSQAYLGKGPVLGAESGEIDSGAFAAVKLE